MDREDPDQHIGTAAHTGAGQAGHTAGTAHSSTQGNHVPEPKPSVAFDAKSLPGVYAWLGNAATQKTPIPCGEASGGSRDIRYNRPIREI